MDKRELEYIKCADKEDAVETICKLPRGLDWDFCYELNGEQGIWIEIKRGGKNGKQFAES